MDNILGFYQYENHNVKYFTLVLQKLYSCLGLTSSAPFNCANLHLLASPSRR